MNAREYPFYGLGIIAFSLAESDGAVQGRERFGLRNLIERWSDDVDADFNVAEIVFSILSKTKTTSELSYDRGMHYIKLGKEYMTESMKEKFVFLIRDLAHSFPPVTEEEKKIVERFQDDLANL